jgi:hypothetical protein
MPWTFITIEWSALALGAVMIWHARSQGARWLSTCLWGMAFGSAVELMIVSRANASYEYGPFLFMLGKAGHQTRPVKSQATHASFERACAGRDGFLVTRALYDDRDLAFQDRPTRDECAESQIQHTGLGKAALTDFSRLRRDACDPSQRAKMLSRLQSHWDAEGCDGCDELGDHPPMPGILRTPSSVFWRGFREHRSGAYLLH